MRWNVLALVIGLVAPVEAAASACSAAKASLARLEKPGGRYAGAIRQQRAQMTKTRGMLARHGCGRSRSGTCRTLLSAYARMQRNLRKLERGGVSASRRRRARAKVRRACGEFRANRARIARAMAGETRRVRVRERIERARRARNAPVRPRSQFVETGQSQLRFRAHFARGSYRTMCVRTCDGFAFPASLSTTPGRFHLDAARCSAMCPGRELRLFATTAKSSTVKTARDVETGQPYGSLPFAFRYRERYDAACRCDFKAVTARNGRLTGGPVPRAPQGPATRVPTWRPRFPSVEPERVEPERVATVEREAGPARRTQDGVRIVGETYFPN